MIPPGRCASPHGQPGLLHETQPVVGKTDSPGQACVPNLCRASRQTTQSDSANSSSNSGCAGVGACNSISSLGAGAGRDDFRAIFGAMS